VIGALPSVAVRAPPVSCVRARPLVRPSRAPGRPWVATCSEDLGSVALIRRRRSEAVARRGDSTGPLLVLVMCRT
jgi:hypothetical protein